MDLVYKKMTEETKAIVSRLENLTLAFKLVESNDAELPSLVDGKKSYLGYDLMNQYIDQLDREKEQWYYCDC